MSALTYSNSYNSGTADLFEPGGYLTDYWTDESIKVIKANRNRPFFLYLAHWGIHTPLQATRADYEAVGDIQPHRLRVYAAMTRALDRSGAYGEAIPLYRPLAEAGYLTALNALGFDMGICWTLIPTADAETLDSI